MVNHLGEIAFVSGEFEENVSSEAWKNDGEFLEISQKNGKFQVNGRILRLDATKDGIILSCL